MVCLLSKYWQIFRTKKDENENYVFEIAFLVIKKGSTAFTPLSIFLRIECLKLILSLKCNDGKNIYMKL